MEDAASSIQLYGVLGQRSVHSSKEVGEDADSRYVCIAGLYQYVSVCNRLVYAKWSVQAVRISIHTIYSKLVSMQVNRGSREPLELEHPEGLLICCYDLSLRDLEFPVPVYFSHQ